jgi:transposase-like protein
MWLENNEGAKFWLSVVTELQNRGVEDILISSIDGLKGFYEAINTVFPKTIVQRCIIHQICCIKKSKRIYERSKKSI